MLNWTLAIHLISVPSHIHIIMVNISHVPHLMSFRLMYEDTITVLYAVALFVINFSLQAYIAVFMISSLKSFANKHHYAQQS